MTFPVIELLQVLLGLCVVLAVVVLVRDLIARGRRLQPKSRPTEPVENRATAPGLPELESELE
jgi:hypothetical protein